MPAEITQENVRLLIPGKAAQTAALIAAKRKISMKEALLAFYRSAVYRKLEVEATKYYHYSPEQLFAISGFARKNGGAMHRGPGQSLLLPHKNAILKAWNQRQSAKAIAGMLAAKGVVTTPQNVWKFIQHHC